MSKSTEGQQTKTEEKRTLLSKNFLIRTLMGAVLLLLIGTTCYLGKGYWFGMVSVLCLIGLFEFYRVFQIHQRPVGIAGFLSAAAYLLLLFLQKEDWLAPVLVGAFLLTAACYVLFFEKTDSVKAMAAFFGLFYVVVLLSYLYRLRLEDDGLLLVGLTFLAAWGTDTMAYLSGMLFGKHRMAPVLSPKKTWEGTAGGIVGAALLGALFGYLFRSHFSQFAQPVIACALITALSGVISMIGDLTASAFKRNHGVKDYSHLIPGHGGVLDRFDSIILIAPLIFYLSGLFR